MRNDVVDTQHGQRTEPEHHDRPKIGTNLGGAIPLHEKKPEKHEQGNRNNHRLESRRHNFQPLDRRQYRNCRRYHAIPVKHRGAENPENHDQPCLTRFFLSGMQGKRNQRHDAAFAAIISTHDEGHVLDRYHDDERPEKQGQAAVNIGHRHRNRVIAGENLLHRIQGAGPDIAIDHPEGSQRQGGKTLPGNISRLLVTTHQSCSPSMSGGFLSEPLNTMLA